MKFYKINLLDKNQEVVDVMMNITRKKYLATSVVLETGTRIFHSSNNFSTLKMEIKQLNKIEPLVEIVIYQVASGGGRLFSMGDCNNLLGVLASNPSF